MARAAQVSRATVSYVLNDVDGQRISPATRERVRQIADDLGYRPNAAAYVLRYGRSEIALVELPYWPIGEVVAEHLAAVVMSLEERGYTVLLHFERTQTAERLERACTRIQPVALIAPAEHLTSQFVRTLHASGTAAVIAIGETVTRSVPTILFPQPAIGQTAIRYLVGRRHKRILAVAPKKLEVPRFRDGRLRGARDEAARLRVRLDILLSDEDQRTTGAALHRALRQRNAPTAIYAYNDELALELLDILRDRGVSVPEEVALLGCDDSPIARASRPRLSSVQLWSPSSWEIAADAVDALVQGKKVKRALRAEPLSVSERETS